MEKILPSSNLYSHPNRLLEDHLTGVARLTSLFISEKPEKIQKELNEVCRVVALSHDIGKATCYFQEYLGSEERKKTRLKYSGRARHSLFSAVCAYYLCKELDSNNDLLPFYAFIIVRRHHGNLIDLLDETTLYGQQDLIILKDQVKAIDEKKFSILARKLRENGLPLELDKDIINKWINSFMDELKSIKKQLRVRACNIDQYIILNLLYSMLLDADRSDVVITDASVFERKNIILGNLVDNYMRNATFEDSPINYLREKAYSEITGAKIDPVRKIYSIILPTGLGKTLTSLSFSLKLREKMDLNHRIIYTLPFLSIIDQNSEVFQHVLEANNIKPETSVLLKHHHLSELFYKKDDLEFESDEAQILIEGWNAEIIVTTFVQLFHTLISNMNKSIRKFHRIANSIIILDEFQSIPVKYWLLLNNFLMKLSETLGTYIILVTATEPLIFGREEIKELVKREAYFNVLDRIRVKLMLEKNMKLADLVDLFRLDDGRRYLFIFNTISSAKKFYQMVKKYGMTATYLSTHLPPKERVARINEIIKGKYKIVISTQLVEAGVDIDFDVVVRDFAPLDSINQSAGRCNRNGKYKGEVYIVSLEDDKGRLYSSYIYDSVLIDITRKILTNKKELKESEFLSLIDEYYTETEKKKSQDPSSEIIEAIEKLRYECEDDLRSIAGFKLIKEDYRKTDIFIEMDDDAKKVWNEYIRLRDEKDLVARKKIFDCIKADFYQYVISIPENTRNMPEMVGEIGYVKGSILEDYYDKETGFKTQDEKSIVIW